MSSASDHSVIADPSLRAVLQALEESQRRFMSGDVALWMEHLSRRDDVAILGGWGGHETGWSETQARYQWACARFRAGEAEVTVEYLTSYASGDLAFTTAIERSEVKVEGQERAAPMALRVTHFFRREDSTWKLMLRHADTLVARTPPAGVINGEPGVSAFSTRPRSQSALATAEPPSSRLAGSFPNWIRSVGQRIATWADTCADHYKAAAIYEQLSALTDAELARRGLSRATLAHDVCAACDRSSKSSGRASRQT